MATDQEPNPSAKECRICKDDDPSPQLISPCLCSGSLKYVHKNCLLTWIRTRRSIRCGICLSNYTCNLVLRRMPFLSFIQQELRQVMSFVAILITFTLILVLCLAMAFLSLNQFYTSSWSAHQKMFEHLFNSSFITIPNYCHHMSQVLRKPIPYRDLIVAKVAFTLIIGLPLIFVWTIFFNEVLFVWDQYMEYDIE